MAIKLHLRGISSELSSGREAVAVSGNSVGECLKDLVKQIPAIEKEIFDKDGELLKQFCISVNSEVMFHDELSIPVKDGDEIYLLPLIAGG